MKSLLCFLMAIAIYNSSAAVYSAHSTERKEEVPYCISNNLTLLLVATDAVAALGTINVKSSIAQEAFKNILPPEYHLFIRFHANGNLDKKLLKSAGKMINMPPSTVYEALVWMAHEPKINISIKLTTNWQAKTTKDTVGAGYYSWTTRTQLLEGITVVPGTIALNDEIPVTGHAHKGSIFISKEIESSPRRLAYIMAHELLGHMYSFFKKSPFSHHNETFERWIDGIEKEVRNNWKLIKESKKCKTAYPIV